MTEMPGEDDTLLWKVVRRYGLSPREQNVLFMLLRGVHVKEVASSLGCSYSTVRTYVQRAARKLDCSGMPELLARIVRDGLSADGEPEPAAQITEVAARRYTGRLQEPRQ
jgi:DNA-binding CsgD family transcriptional regulator